MYRYIMCVTRQLRVRRSKVQELLRLSKHAGHLFLKRQPLLQVPNLEGVTNNRSVIPYAIAQVAWRVLQYNSPFLLGVAGFYPLPAGDTENKRMYVAIACGDVQ